MDEDVDRKITTAIEKFFAENSLHSISEKCKAIIQSLISGSMYLKLNEHKNAVQYLFPNASRDFRIRIIKFIQDTCQNLKVHEAKRHPLLLIVDEVIISLSNFSVIIT